jgi:hypothetical protein
MAHQLARGRYGDIQGGIHLTDSSKKYKAVEKKCFHLTLWRSFDVIKSANRPLFPYRKSGRFDFDRDEIARRIFFYRCRFDS